MKPDYLFADSLYAALKRAGAIEERPICGGAGCARARYSKDLCQLHYRRLAKHGNLDAGYGKRKADAEVAR
jgi:hypothetical protein